MMKITVKKDQDWEAATFLKLNILLIKCQPSPFFRLFLPFYGKFAKCCTLEHCTLLLRLCIIICHYCVYSCLFLLLIFLVFLSLHNNFYFYSYSCLFITEEYFYATLQRRVESLYVKFFVYFFIYFLPIYFLCFATLEKFSTVFWSEMYTKIYSSIA